MFTYSLLPFFTAFTATTAVGTAVVGVVPPGPAFWSWSWSRRRGRELVQVPERELVQVPELELVQVQVQVLEREPVQVPEREPELVLVVLSRSRCGWRGWGRRCRRHPRR